MKALKKAMSVLVSLLMIFTFALPAFAADSKTVNVTVDDKLDGHTFAAYQIFSGNQDANGTLSDVQWGDGINDDAFLKALKQKYATEFGTCTTAASVAEKLGDTTAVTPEKLNEIAKLAYSNKTDVSTLLKKGNNDLKAGYYLIVDTTTGTGDTDAVLNAALLQVTGDTINISSKTDKPSVEKKVLENTKYNKDDGYGDRYNDVADYNIGDAVPFKLIGTVPDMTQFTTYKYEFNDTLSDGLTAPAAGAVKVYVSDNKEGTANKTDITNKASVKVSDQKITVSFDDLKAVDGVAKGKYILVEYEATLNKNAVIGLPGNPNKVDLTYSNNPNGAGEGKTPEDEVIVFTYELDTTKVDGDNTGKKLEGAEFKLRNADGKYVKVNVDNKVIGWADTEAEGTALTSDANGLFKVIGLDAGTYYLTETKAPGGYNKLTEDITLEVKATTKNGQDWTTGKASEALTALEVKVNGGTAATGDTTNGTVGITVENHKGATLPGTGGIGTTIFYVVGGLLMLGAAVLLITKKRMSGDK